MIFDSVAVNQCSTPNWSLFQDLVRYPSAGFNSIGLCRNKVEELGVAETADLLFEMQMKVTSLSWAGGFTGSNGMPFLDAVADAQQMIRQASVLGARTLVIYPGGNRGHTGNHLRRLLRLALDELVPLAEDLEVRLAIEPVLGPEAISLNFAGGFSSTLELISGYPANRVGLVADLFYLARDATATRDFSKFANRIALVQISDLRVMAGGCFGRSLPGTGHLPICSWLNRLDHCNYVGPIELELHGPEFEFLGHQDLLVAGREFLLQHDQPVVFEEPTHEETNNVASRVDSTNTR